jgi:hypothetical protein
MLEVLIVWDKNGAWEAEWEPLRGTPWGDLLSVVKPEDLEHALHGWSKPFVTALGLPPEGGLRKLPPEGKLCMQRRKCPLHNPKKCFPTAEELPWCYEPDGIESEAVRSAASKLVQLWHEGVYVVVPHA